MFKKTLLLLGAMSLSMPVLAADITSPFYVPTKGNVSTVTSLERNVMHAKKSDNKLAMRDYTVSEELGYGVVDGLGVYVDGSNAWSRDKDNGDKYRKDTNTAWSVGTKYNVFNDALKWQVAAKYGQSNLDTVSQNFDRKGTYKYMDLGTKVGYEVKGYLPYVAFNYEQPIGEREMAPLYTTKAGVYKLICNKLAVDAGVKHQYAHSVDMHTWSAVAEVSYYLTQNITAGVYGEYVVDGHISDAVADHARVTGNTAGLRLRAQF